tara:strand:+ start:69329 stop:69745 length:417 start_codon:yes stop_codon:yes gene_type:complete
MLDAPIELVWDAWTIPEHIVKWWNPKGSDTHIEKHEFVVGGNWKYTMLMPDGSPFIAEGTYTEIIHHKLISSKADFKPMTQGVEIRSTFKSIGEKTEFTFYIIHPTEDYKLQQERMGIQNGWGSVFSRLDEFLTTIKL